MNISVVIPTLDNPDDVFDVIKQLNQQLLLPSEIVIVDSSSKDDIEKLSKNIDSVIPITYSRFGRAYRNDRLIMILKTLPIIKYFFQSNPKGRAYPYEATNHGSLIAKNEWLAFLDATTLPSKHWIKDYAETIECDKVEVVFGNTQYLAETFFQKILRASTYGANGIETAPGSFMRRKDFLNGFSFDSEAKML